MSQLRLLILLISLPLARFVTASKNVTETEFHYRSETRNSSSDSMINNQATFNQASDFRSNQIDPIESYLQATLGKSTHKPHLMSERHPKVLKRRKQQNPNSILSVIKNIIDNLDKIDLKRVLSDSMSQIQKGKLDLNEILKIAGIKRRSGTINHSIIDLISADGRSSQTGPIDQSTKTSGSRPKLNGSSILAESDNLLSITKQLVKLARTGFVGGEFDPSGQILNSAAGAGLLAPLIGVPTMLSAASQALQSAADESGEHSEHHHHHAAARGDMFWVVMPAIIAVGAGVIIVPLIAAWLISSAMSQNTMTVAAGRRRRKRDLLDQYLDPLSLRSTYSGLFSMLDIHRLLEDEPDLVISKLSKLHDSLESVTKHLINSTSFKTHVSLNNQLGNANRKS